MKICVCGFVALVDLEAGQDTLGLFQHWKAAQIGPSEPRQPAFHPRCGGRTGPRTQRRAALAARRWGWSSSWGLESPSNDASRSLPA